MICIILPGERKNVLIITTTHKDPDICTKAAEKKKPMVIDFYNSQHYKVDFVNEMLKD